MFAENLDVFLRTDDFGVDAVFDADSDVKVIFDREYVDVLDIASRYPVALGKESDFSAALGKTLEVDSVTYTIVNVEPDGTGMIMLRLRAP